MFDLRRMGDDELAKLQDGIIESCESERRHLSFLRQFGKFFEVSVAHHSRNVRAGESLSAKIAGELLKRAGLS